MVDLGLYNFVKHALETGQTEAQIHETLAHAGWAEVLITEALTAAQQGKEPVMPHLHTGGVPEHADEVSETELTQPAAGGWFERRFPMFFGRMGVGGYWKAVLLSTGISLVLWFLGQLYGGLLMSSFLQMYGPHTGFWYAVAAAAALNVFLSGIFGFFMLGALVRRLHDLGISGWALLGLFALPIIGYLASLFAHSAVPYVVGAVTPVAFLFLAWFWPGSSLQNRYGAFTYYSWGRALFGAGDVGRSFVVSIVVNLILVAGIAAALAALWLNAPTVTAHIRSAVSTTSTKL